MSDKSKSAPASGGAVKASSGPVKAGEGQIEGVSLNDLSLTDLSAKYEEFNIQIDRLRLEQGKIGEVIAARVGATRQSVESNGTGNGHSNGTVQSAPAPARTLAAGVSTPAKPATAKATGGGGKASGGGKAGGEKDDKSPAAKGTWKPAILQFLRDRVEEGAKLKDITVACIEKVKSGEIQTKISADNNPQVAQNVSQALNAMKKDELVLQDDDKTYFLTKAGVAWLDENGL